MSDVGLRDGPVTFGCEPPVLSVFGSAFVRPLCCDERGPDITSSTRVPVPSLSAVPVSPFAVSSMISSSSAKRKRKLAYYIGAGGVIVRALFPQNSVAADCYLEQI